MLASERQVYILKQLQTQGAITLKDISDALQTSESTIRRDFEELEKQGKLKRVHGGAIKLGMATTLTEDKELSMKQKANLQVDEKRKLAQYCASLVKDGECVFIDGGTTFIFMMEYLEGKKITVVSHNNFIETIADSTIDLIRVGGNYLPNYNMNVGPIALQTIQEFNYDHAFIGCAGIDVIDEVVYAAEIASAQMKTAAMKNTLQAYLVVDDTKLDTRGFYRFANFEEFDHIVVSNYPKERKKAKNVTTV